MMNKETLDILDEKEKLKLMCIFGICNVVVGIFLQDKVGSMMDVVYEMPFKYLTLVKSRYWVCGYILQGVVDLRRMF